MGRTLGHYKILDMLGAGGMGEVYRAVDTTLDREVALKILPPELAESKERLDRFQREAKTLATLNHPNIVHVYTVEEDDGTHFLTMELVEEQPLSHLIPRGGMPLERIFDIAIPLADALSEAHEQGVTHRDFKPANVMVDRRGRPKILDFGLAKLVAKSAPMDPGGRRATSIATAVAARSESLTQPGTIMGTAPYMSPEQLAGKAVDHRTDIFALGVALYELCTGRLPFAGENSAELVSSIMRDAARPVTQVRQELPRQLGRIIGHCLEKNVIERFQSALDVRNELRSLRKEVDTGVLTPGDAAVSGIGTATPEPTPTGTGEPSVSVSAVSTSATAPSEFAPGRGGGRAVWRAVGGAGVIGALLLAFWLGQRGGGAGRVDDVSDVGPGAGDLADSSYFDPAGGIPATSQGTITLAVLPFADRSPEGDQEYFTDGLSEELITALGRIPELRVAGQSSSFAFKGKDVPLQSVGEQLGVANILEGSVRKAENQIRVSVQLVTAGEGFQLWSETYERTLDDVFAVQDDIANSVVKALQLPLLGREAVSMTSRHVDPEAYNLVLQGRYFADKLGKDDLRRAAEYFERALDLDRDYALAWAGLAETYSQRATRGYVPFDEGYARAREAANRALEADNKLAESWATLGRIRRAYDWDWTGADEAFERALELEPRNAEVLRGAASLAANLGRLDQAVELTQRAVEVDPLRVSSYHNLGLYSYFAGRLDLAESALQKALELNPDGPVAHSLLCRVYLAWSQPERALEEIESEPHPALRLFGLALARHALEQEAEAQAALDELVETWGSQAAYQIAEIHAFRGDRDQAFEWLDRAYAERDSGTAETKVDPLFIGLHGDPRWPGFLRKLRLTS